MGEVLLKLPPPYPEIHWFSSEKPLPIPTRSEEHTSDSSHHAISYAVFCYLDGTSKDRFEQVDRFNNSPEIPIFLISLKAGGTGLNLTSADYVIHYDPWWNPAVEDQATDRTHRIGQTRQVFSYKMICENTVEEKILKLQESKKGIADSIIPGQSAWKSLTRSDLEMLFEV